VPRRGQEGEPFMRLAGPVFESADTPEGWVAAVRRAGYTASDAPLSAEADDATVAAYVNAAREAGIVIAEVGAWSNPIDPDPAKAGAAIEKCKLCLDLAERLGARCCVNIVGSRHPGRWDGPHPDNLTADTFDLVVRSVRDIIDAVKPRRTFYTLETMPWIFPSSADEYVDLLRAIDRPAAAVHLDPVNLVNCPSRAYRTGDLIRECFAKLGARIRGCHAKDVVLRDSLTVHLEECPPGTGVLDYAAYLGELAKLERDTTLFIEHLPRDAYAGAAAHIRSVARRCGLELA
jgi:sugar phosphate isomerase/epimerase